MLDAPCLQLGMLPHLHAVRLHSICPANTFLPENCSLHLFGLSEQDFTTASSCWDSALTNIRTFDFDGDDLCIDKLPTFFSSLQNVTTVEFIVLNLGAADAYLQLDCLSHMQRLYLGANLVYVQVPARVSWHKVSITGFDAMGLSFADPIYFAEHVPNAHFKYSYHTGPSLFMLSSA